MIIGIIPLAGGIERSYLKMPLIVLVMFCIAIIVILCDCTRKKTASQLRRSQIIIANLANNNFMFSEQFEKMFQEYMEETLVDETEQVVQKAIPIWAVMAKHSYQQELRAIMRTQKMLKSRLRVVKCIELHNRDPPLNFCFSTRSAGENGNIIRKGVV